MLRACQSLHLLLLAEASTPTQPPQDQPAHKEPRPGTRRTLSETQGDALRPLEAAEEPGGEAMEEVM